MKQTPENSKVWYLNAKKVPDDYKTVGISLEQKTDPTLPLKWCADGSLQPLPVYKATLSRGGVDVVSNHIWPHRPPLDVVIHYLTDDEFMQLLGRKRGPVDSSLASAGWPEPEDCGFNEIGGNQ